MAKKIGLCVLVLLITASVLYAQSNDPMESVFDPSKMGLKPKGFLDHLLDANKFSMSHSYSLSVFNVGNQTVSQGLYLNTMNYRFSDPLLLQVRVGYLHQPFGSLGQQSATSGNLFLQRAMLQYKPTENMTFTVDYQVVPSQLYSPYLYQYNPYRRSLWED